MANHYLIPRVIRPVVAVKTMSVIDARAKFRETDIKREVTGVQNAGLTISKIGRQNGRDLLLSRRLATSELMLHRLTLATIAITAPVFAAGGALSRFTLRTTETRWQIAAFTALAAGLEGVVRLSGRNRASAIRAALNGAAAAIVIVSVKFHLEPDAREADSAAIRHVAKSAIHTAASVARRDKH